MLLAPLSSAFLGWAKEAVELKNSRVGARRARVASELSTSIWPPTIRIAFPRATAFARRFWLPAGKYPPPTRIAAATTSPPQCLDCWGRRSGAVAFLSLTQVSNFTTPLTTSAYENEFPRANVSYISRPELNVEFKIRFFAVRRATSSASYKFPPSDASASKNFFSRCAGRRRHANSRFGVPATAALSLRVCRFFLSAARRPSSRSQPTSRRQVCKSSKSKKIFFAARQSESVFSSAARPLPFHKFLFFKYLSREHAISVRTGPLETSRETGFLRV
ncbi:hypothetical protein R3P38DRAFT_2776809 [Favolaschia claudopus]|uniref:Uncharacterized protein n=1 Tax=Favolaschia claudopus TaxID=2862362 RepID=A0AAW0BN08_9AGAR